jgi:hypothetical protein
MAEHIERAAAVKVVLRERKPTNSVAQNRMLSTIQRDLLTMCAADVAPVVHGKWIKGPSNPYYSECFVECRDETPFCPNCGAMMDGGTT